MGADVTTRIYPGMGHLVNDDEIALDASSSDDDYGPSLPPAPGSAAETAFLAEQAREVEARKAARKDAKL